MFAVYVYFDSESPIGTSYFNFGSGISTELSSLVFGKYVHELSVNTQQQTIAKSLNIFLFIYTPI